VALKEVAPQSKTVSMRIPVQTRESASRLARQTGESIGAVIAGAVQRAEEELFYRQLAQASARTFDGAEGETDYLRENESWMRDAAGDMAREPEEKFWR